MHDLSAAESWFAARGWEPFAFQREVWQAQLRGRSGLLHATTGSGKTYAVWLGTLLRAAQRGVAGEGRGAPPLGVLWLTPMRALAADTTRALRLPLDSLAPTWTLGQRTGDTPSGERAKQDRRLPTALVTTPESLSLMLTREHARTELAGVHTVIVDEWHELIGNKRGVQVQLALARLAAWNPAMVIWGLSATLGNLEEAMQALVGPVTRPPPMAPPPRRKGRARAAATHEAQAALPLEEGAAAGRQAGPQAGPQAGSAPTPAATPEPALVRGRVDKTLVIDTLLPAQPSRFSWGGHLGAQMQQPVVEEIEKSGPTLVFTNVRSQAEIWYQLLLQARPEWAGQIALHHGSLDKSVREWVEAGLKEGTLRAVVATSSLDLGVDFLPVERVLQIGSAKGVARLLQRAGRSGHQPGRPSRVTLVPTHMLELVEAAAARRAATAGRIEKREVPAKPLDVLVQHLVTVALGGGFTADAMFDEVRRAPSYQALTRAEFDWALAFVTQGGESLHAYPDFHRVVQVDGRWRVTDRRLALRHRLQVGTIVSEASMQVKWLSGGTIGQIEEGFIARLNKGDCFVFAGRVLEYVRTQEMTAYVRKAAGKRGIVPAWAGGRMPLSSEMADTTLELLEGARQGDFFEPELQCALPMLRTQARLSKLPGHGRLLVERYRSKEGHHLYLYPFAGRNVHIGLAGLLAWRLAKARPNTFSMSVNDYGFELLAAEPIDVAALQDGSAFAGELGGGTKGAAGDDSLLHDVLASLNAGELAQRRFREIARIAGLVFNGYPGQPKSTRQLQASSSLFWEVFRKYDAGNLLLTQAEREVMAQELELKRLAAALKRMRGAALELVDLEVPSPFSLPLMVERFREELSTEKLADRLARILREAEAVVGAVEGEGGEAGAVEARVEQGTLPEGRASAGGRRRGTGQVRARKRV